MTNYKPGHVKHNPELNEAAIRTIFPIDQSPQLAAMAWLIVTQSVGARTAPMDEIDGVDGWVDVYEPPSLGELYSTN